MKYVTSELQNPSSGVDSQIHIVYDHKTPRYISFMTARLPDTSRLWSKDSQIHLVYGRKTPRYISFIIARLPDTRGKNVKGFRDTQS